MLLLLKGGLITLDRFIDAMAENNDVEVVNLRDAENAVKRIYELDSVLGKDDSVLTFNSVGSNLKLMGTEFWKAKGVKVVNILVDHPMYHLKQILGEIHSNYYVGCIDRGHVEFLESILPAFSKQFFFIPHGGIEIGASAKNIDVLYVGNIFDPDSIIFPSISIVDAEKFYSHIISFYEMNQCVEVQGAVDDFLIQNELSLSTEERIMLIDCALTGVEKSFISQRRLELIARIADSFKGTEYKFHLCGGECWNDLVDEYKDTIVFHGMKTPDECLKYISESKILINDLPYFSNGAHERIFNGMLNRAVTLSNTSTYLEERFTDGEDILLWDGTNYEKALSDIHRVLKDDTLQKTISNNAYDKARNDKWNDRIKLVVENI